MTKHKYEESVQPYELLVRWRDGKISGAHVGFIDVLTKDGVVIKAEPQNVQAVDVGAGVGFPLKDILDTVNADALVAYSVAVAEKEAALLAENVAKEAEVKALQARNDAEKEAASTYEKFEQAVLNHAAEVAALKEKVAAVEAERDALKVAQPEGE